MEGEQPYLGDLLTMVIDHLLAGMTLQVGDMFQNTNTPPKFNVAPETMVVGRQAFPIGKLFRGELFNFGRVTQKLEGNLYPDLYTSTEMELKPHRNVAYINWKPSKKHLCIWLV